MAANTSLVLADRPGEGKTDQMRVTDFDAYFGESALTVSMLPKF
ncbi:hypothetical protein N8524_04765 [Candidatus Puniceispirillum sp.]|nr:hypothetical protein [Candidatus Puniceispirillum sp.]